MSKNTSTLFNWLFDGALFVAIVGTFLFFTHYGMSLFYPAPDYEDFCGEPEVVSPEQDLTKAQCEAQGGRWQAYDKPRVLPPAQQVSTTSTSTEQAATSTAGYCDRDYTCRQALEDARNSHGQLAFAILSIIGLIVAVYGFRQDDRGVLSTSLATGGVLLILISTIRFWNQADDYLQFFLLLIALVVFIYFGYQREKE